MAHQQEGNALAVSRANICLANSIIAITVIQLVPVFLFYA